MVHLICDTIADTGFQGVYYKDSVRRLSGKNRLGDQKPLNIESCNQKAVVVLPGIVSVAFRILSNCSPYDQGCT